MNKKNIIKLFAIALSVFILFVLILFTLISLFDTYTNDVTFEGKFDSRVWKYKTPEQISFLGDRKKQISINFDKELKNGYSNWPNIVEDCIRCDMVYDFKSSHLKNGITTKIEIKDMLGNFLLDDRDSKKYVYHLGRIIKGRMDNPIVLYPKFIIYFGDNDIYIKSDISKDG